MPTFELTDAKGGVYQIEAPSEQAAFEAFSQAMGGDAPAPESSSLAGVAKSIGVGAAEGLIGLAGLPGDLYNLGFGEAGKESDYGSASFKKQIEAVTGEFYKPRGAAESLANKAGQFAPLMIGGPGSLAAKLATRVAAPAVASEIGGAVAGPYGEVAGALIGAAGGAGAASVAQRFNAAAKARNAAPTAEDTIKAAKGQFKAAEDMNLTVTPDFATNAAAKMRADLKGFDPEAQGVVFKAADRLEGLGRAAVPQAKEITYLPSSSSLALPDAPSPAQMQKYSRIENVPLSQARGTQSKMEWDRFNRGEYGKPVVSGYDVLPVAVRRNDGEYLIFDGHHRAVKAVNGGASIMPMHVIDAKDYAPQFAGLKAARRSISDDDLLRELSGIPAAPITRSPASSSVLMNDVELVRKQLTTLKTSPDASVREAARRAITSLQESQTALAPAQVLRGDAGEYTKLMSDAIANYAAGKRSNTVMGKVALGDLNAATAGSGANQDNALRQAIKQLVRPVNNDIVPKASRLGFNAEEIAAMNKVARGTATGNAARYLGKLAPTGSVSGVLSGGAGFAAAGPAGAIALPAVGFLAKKIGDLSTKRAVQELDALVRSRSPLAQQVAAQLPPAIVQKLPSYTKLLLATSSLRPIAAQPVPQGRQ